MKRWWRGMALALALPGVVAGQDLDVDRLDLPNSVTQEVVAFFGDPSTSIVEGDLEVAVGEFISGPLAILEGHLTVDGSIEGDVMVINGDLLLGPDGEIDGDVTVIGGRFRGDPGRLSGDVRVYEERYDFERRTRRFGEDDRRGWRRDRWARSKISTRSEVNYNRVEGLPIMVGPVFQTGRDVNFRVDALAIYRTVSGFHVDPDEMGYFLRAEQSVGRENRFTIAGTAHSMVQPIDPWRLDDFEASMATLLLHEDYHDYFEREGFSLAARGRIPEAGLFMELQYRDEEHSFVPAADPWTLRNDDRTWRPQPLVAEGKLRSLTGELTIDRRNDSDDPSDGWFFSAKGTYGIDGELTVPSYLEPAPRPTTIAGNARVASTAVRSGVFDLRRYTRLGPDTDISLRGFWAGSLDGEPLAPQYQHTLGGVGSLPGHALMSLDCGARSGVNSISRGSLRLPAFPSYGCDQVALFQAQYRGTFSVGWGDDRDPDRDNDWDWYPEVDFNPSWTVFFNAGKGWSLSDPASPAYFGPDSETLMDAGVGFFVGGVGLYWAWPLNQDFDGGRFFLRLERRF